MDAVHVAKMITAESMDRLRFQSQRNEFRFLIPGNRVDSPTVGVGAGVESSKREKLSYQIVSISNKDVDDVIGFLRTFFFRDEPLNVAVNLLDTPDAVCHELEQFCTDFIPEGVSVMAVSDSGEILGVCLNSISRRSSDPCSENDEECSHPKFRKILHLLTMVSKQADIFGQFPTVDTVLNVEVISVSDAARGQGIAKALFHKCRQIAVEQRMPLVEVICTSHYSAKAVERLGFQCIYELLYKDHLDSNGEPVFTPEPPHDRVKVFVMPTADL
nr:PREDICTED: dopamine N-acetyltransferase-like isoform X1 [Bemisia tabaci]